jgi:hypothetical protein
LKAGIPAAGDQLKRMSLVDPRKCLFHDSTVRGACITGPYGIPYKFNWYISSGSKISWILDLAKPRGRKKKKKRKKN